MNTMKLVLLTASLTVMSLTASAASLVDNIKLHLPLKIADDSKGVILCFDEKQSFIFAAILDEKGITGEVAYQSEITEAEYTITKVTLPTSAQFNSGDVIALEIENATAAKYNVPVTIDSFARQEDGYNIYTASAVITTEYLTNAAATCAVGVK